MDKELSDSIARLISLIGGAITLGFIAWIGVQVSAIPVMQETLKHIQDDIGNRSQNNANMIADHEMRLRALEAVDRQKPNISKTNTY